MTKSLRLVKLCLVFLFLYLKNGDKASFCYLFALFVPALGLEFQGS